MSVLRLAVVAEDRAGFRAVTVLVDLACVERVDWLDGVLDECREWLSRSATARDLDRHPKRRCGLEQVRTHIRWPFVIVAALAEPEVEAWHVAGFEPRDAVERQRVDGERARLGFDPTTQAHRLTSTVRDADTDAKRVLDALCGGDEGRMTACLDLHVLRRRGEDVGSRAFLLEVDERIVPSFTHIQRSTSLRIPHFSAATRSSIHPPKHSGGASVWITRGEHAPNRAPWTRSARRAPALGRVLGNNAWATPVVPDECSWGGLQRMKRNCRRLTEPGRPQWHWAPYYTAPSVIRHSMRGDAASQVRYVSQERDGVVQQRDWSQPGGCL